MCSGALLGGCVTRQLPYLWLQEVAQRDDQQTVEECSARPSGAVWLPSKALSSRGYACESTEALMVWLSSH